MSIPDANSLSYSTQTHHIALTSLDKMNGLLGRRCRRLEIGVLVRIVRNEADLIRVACGVLPVALPNRHRLDIDVAAKQNLECGICQVQ